MQCKLIDKAFRKNILKEENKDLAINLLSTPSQNQNALRWQCFAINNLLREGILDYSNKDLLKQFVSIPSQTQDILLKQYGILFYTFNYFIFNKNEDKDLAINILKEPVKHQEVLKPKYVLVSKLLEKNILDQNDRPLITSLLNNPNQNQDIFKKQVLLACNVVLKNILNQDDKNLIINLLNTPSQDQSILNLKYALCGYAIYKNILTKDDKSLIKDFIKENFINELNYDNDTDLQIINDPSELHYQPSNQDVSEEYISNDYQHTLGNKCYLISCAIDKGIFIQNQEDKYFIMKFLIKNNEIRKVLNNYNVNELNPFLIGKQCQLVRSAIQNKLLLTDTPNNKINVVDNKLLLTNTPNNKINVVNKILSLRRGQTPNKIVRQNENEKKEELNELKDTSNQKLINENEKKEELNELTDISNQELINENQKKEIIVNLLKNIYSFDDFANGEQYLLAFIALEKGILNEFDDYNLLKNLLKNKTENYSALLAKHDIARKLVMDETLNKDNKSILNKLFKNDLNFLTMGYLNKNQKNNIIEILCNLAKMAIEKKIFNNDERTLIDRLINTQSESQTVKEKQNLLKNLAIEKGIITA